MEKNQRLFLKNLPSNVTRNEIEEQFQDYGVIRNVEIKEKKDLDGNEIKFAFINIVISERNLNACFKHVNNFVLNGHNIHVEVAKESFLARLQREREEAAAKAVPTAGSKLNNTESSRVDSDISKDIYSVNSKVCLTKDCNVVPKENKICFKEEPRVNIVTKFPKIVPPTPTANNVEEPVEWNGKQENEKISYAKGNKTEAKYKNPKVVVKKEITESEMKRLKSVQEKKMAFKAKEQVLRDALNAVDNKTWGNKIVFADDIDVMETSDIQTGKQKKLFDDEGDEDEISSDKNEFKISGRINEKLLKLQSNFGNDKRFTLDDRFIDNEETIEEDEEIESSLQQEKKRELDILQNILGVPMQMKDNNSTVAKRKSRMIRYDPTENKHHEYEITTKKHAPMKTETKEKISHKNDTEKNDVIPVSKNTFYTVSNSLVNSLKQEEGFSLLRTFGNETTIPNNAVDGRLGEDQKYEFNFTSKNPFKYDSSDNEEIVEAPIDNPQEMINKLCWHDNLFFCIDDPRFKGAEQFFNKQSIPQEEFKSLRRELKQIVRTKIRKNIRKNSPWAKRIIKKRV